MEQEKPTEEQKTAMRIVELMCYRKRSYTTWWQNNIDFFILHLLTHVESSKSKIVRLEETARYMKVDLYDNNKNKMMIK